MKNEESLIVAQLAKPIRFSPEAEQKRKHALAVASMVEAVATAEDQNCAVEAQRNLRACIKTCEDARKEVKEPFLDMGRKIDAAAKEFTTLLKEEELRIATLIGNYQQAELEKVRAAERARAAELERIENERREAERKAEMEAENAMRAARNEAEKARIAAALEAEKIRQEERAKQQLETLGVAPATTKVEGQIVRETIQWEVTDIWALARAHPGCVKIEPCRQQINELLALGVKVTGVRTWKETKSSVRISKQETVEV